VALPTSLIGMVDAAIGGKTGIDFHGKNLIGTFYLADFVLVDPNLLKSFSDQIQMPGWGEIIKYACIKDPSIFDELAHDPLGLNKIIEKSIQVKVDIVNQDLKESGPRRTLNYGHTFGHAIEAATDFQLTHDQAISIGMCLANRVAQKLKKQDPKTAEKIQSTLKTFNLPTEFPKELTLTDLTDLIKKDKKRQGDIINFVIVPILGKAETIPLKPDELVELAK
jgi:3-dehydroquinate synthase